MGVVREAKPQQIPVAATVKSPPQYAVATYPRNETSRSFMQYLPPEIFSIFASYIFATPQTLLHMELCCKSWRTSVYAHFMWPKVARRLLHEQLFACDEFSMKIIENCEPPKQQQLDDKSPVKTVASFVTAESNEIQQLKKMLCEVKKLKKRHLITIAEMTQLMKVETEAADAKQKAQQKQTTVDQSKQLLPHNYMKIAIISIASMAQCGKQSIAYHFATGGSDAMAVKVMHYEQKTKPQHKFVQYYDSDSPFCELYYSVEHVNYEKDKSRTKSHDQRALSTVQFGSMLQGRAMVKGVPVAIYYQVVKNIDSLVEFKCIVRVKTNKKKISHTKFFFSNKYTKKKQPYNQQLEKYDACILTIPYKDNTYFAEAQDFVKHFHANKKYCYKSKSLIIAATFKEESLSAEHKHNVVKEATLEHLRKQYKVDYVDVNGETGDGVNKLFLKLVEQHYSEAISKAEQDEPHEQAAAATRGEQPKACNVQ